MSLMSLMFCQGDFGCVRLIVELPSRIIVEVFKPVICCRSASLVVAIFELDPVIVR